MPKRKRVEVEVETDTNYYPKYITVPEGDETTIKQLSNNVPDRIVDVSAEGNTAIVHIPNGRVKILPDNKKIKPGYSARHGGVDLNKSILPGSHHPDWLFNQTRLERDQEKMNNILPKRKRRKNK